MITNVNILRGPLREIVDKNKIIIQTEKQARVIDILNILSDKYGNSFRNFVFDKTNKVNSYIVLALNGVNINNINGVETLIEDNSELLILSAIGGG
jgi:molybdopterin converting factor small subunit